MSPKSSRLLFGASTVCLAAMMAATTWLYMTLPRGAAVPIHFSGGSPDGFAGKGAVFGLPAIALWIHLLFLAIARAQRKLEASKAHVQVMLAAAALITTLTAAGILSMVAWTALRGQPN